MDLYNDQIMLLPENLGGFLYMISKGEILNALEKKEEILIEPKQPAFNTPDYSKSIPGFEGLEAIEVLSAEHVFRSEYLNPCDRNRQVYR